MDICEVERSTLDFRLLSVDFSPTIHSEGFISEPSSCAPLELLLIAKDCFERISSPRAFDSFVWESQELSFSYLSSFRDFFVGSSLTAPTAAGLPKFSTY